MALFLSRTITKYRPHTHQFYNVSVKSFSVSSLKQQQRKPQNDNANVTISTASDKSHVSTDVRPIGERIKENTKTASYFGVIIGGVVVTGALFLAICRELLSSSSPNSVYSDALKLCTEVGLMSTTEITLGVIKIIMANHLLRFPIIMINKCRTHEFKIY